MGPFGNYNPNYASDMAEGTVSSVETAIKKFIKDPQPTFVRMVILDTISDPYFIDENKINYWRHILGVSNIKFANALPRNSVVAQRMLSGPTNISQPIFLFPFFPSHLALPCKPGEMVWTIFENPSAKLKEIGYWLCRITEPHVADDVNHTHHARQLEYSMEKSIIDDAAKPIYEMRNGQIAVKREGDTLHRYVVNNSRILSSEDEEVFEKLITDTDASKITQYESIPRFKKRPGDVVLEGSNNTLIVLGTDRAGPIAKYDLENTQDNNSPSLIYTSDLIGNAGSIDLVAGRGVLSTTGGLSVPTTGIFDGEKLKDELAKSKSELSDKEGDPDLVFDRSRILISQRTYVDTNFSVDKYNKNYITETPKIADNYEVGDAAIAIKSDKIRIIARSDLQIIVTGFSSVTGSTMSGSKQENSDLSSWASITLKSNGDIVFAPSTAGAIKLGGDNADRAILCTSVPATNNSGSISALPIATSAGGFVGTNGGKNKDAGAVAKVKVPDLGTFASKILVTAS